MTHYPRTDGARTGPLDSLRPIGFQWEKVLPGTPRYRAVYEVMGYVQTGPDEFRELVERVKFERL